MSDSSRLIAGLRTTVVPASPRGKLVVVMLHGYAMGPADLAPFATSLGIDGHFFVPEAPLTAVPSGRAWWEMDLEARTVALSKGPRDLASEHPPGVPAAREALVAFLESVQREIGRLPLVLVGFSQGGMLACDAVLRNRLPVAGLALLSSSRIADDEWAPLAGQVRNLPVFVSHGRTDADLAFAAGEALRDLLLAGGAQVQWVPFDQGHEIPLVVWRSLRKFLSTLTKE